uniref:Uncharacterized protein n=1 Tax=Romanomermis culicivorax TaxID=13658 RepID=A0A915IH36_ROMCU
MIFLKKMIKGLSPIQIAYYIIRISDSRRLSETVGDKNYNILLLNWALIRNSKEN